MTNFSSSLIGSAIGSGIVVSVAALLNYWFSKKLEAFKWLHPNRAQALVALSPLLLEVHACCLRWLVIQTFMMEENGPSPDAADAAFNEAKEKTMEFSEFITSKAALLETGLVKQLRTFAKKHQEILGLAPTAATTMDGLWLMANDIFSDVESIQGTIRKELGGK